ncbi:MAG: heme-dependent peroxidase [Candidatus Tectomicrobia bacterium]|nr:heme-dependent peroxidase [Candidatus Tectomicrobia bacterium]
MPETLEGWAVLHHIFRVRWAAWNRLGEKERFQILAEASGYLERIAKAAEGESALFSLLGHKGDLLVLHFRRTLEQLNEAELGLRRLRLMEHLEEATSYLSFLELGLYEMTVKTDAELRQAGLKPDSKEWKEAWKERMDKEAQRMGERLYMPMPPDRYLCFYPMNKRRGEHKNWYAVPIGERQQMMREHGLVGRRYAGRVQQIITGSIGFDDWEWGVYLFARDPLVFKKLVYEMRFDEASVWYGEFGPFYTGIRVPPRELPRLFAGRVPAL